MRASQLWHWIYHRGARDFGEMRNVARRCSSGSPSATRSRARRSSPSRCPPTARASGCCAWPPAHARQGRRDRVRLYPGVGSRHALRLEPGRLHAQLHVLPHRHAAAGAQSDGGGDRRRRCWSRATGSAIFPAASRRPTGSCPRARACARCPTSSSWAWASRSTISTRCATRSRC